MRARLKMSTVATAALLVVALLGGAQRAAALSGSPIQIGAQIDDQASVAVDQSGTAYVAWDNATGGASNMPDVIQYCVIPSGGKACLHTGNLPIANASSLGTVDGQPDYGVNVLVDGSTVVILADVSNLKNTPFDQQPLQEWQSTNAGA